MRRFHKWHFKHPSMLFSATALMGTTQYTVFFFEISSDWTINYDHANYHSVLDFIQIYLFNKYSHSKTTKNCAQTRNSNSFKFVICLHSKLSTICSVFFEQENPKRIYLLLDLYCDTENMHNHNTFFLSISLGNWKPNWKAWKRSTGK